LLDDELGEHRGEALVAGPQARGGEEVPLRDPDEHPSAASRELVREVGHHVGQQDPDRVETVAGVGADEATVTRDLVRPGRTRGPRGQVAHRGILELDRLDPPRQQVVAIDDDVEATRGDGVDDRQAGRPVVDQGLGVALHRVLGQRLALDVLHGQALGPDLAERRADEVARELPVVLGGIDGRRRGRPRRRVPADRRGFVDRREDVGGRIAQR
jgi:hypothetical protein